MTENNRFFYSHDFNMNDPNYNNTFSRRRMINSYIDLLRDTNNCFANMIDLMRREEQTLSRLIFETYADNLRYSDPTPRFSNSFPFTNNARNRARDQETLFTTPIRSNRTQLNEPLDILRTRNINRRSNFISSPLSPLIRPNNNSFEDNVLRIIGTSLIPQPGQTFSVDFDDVPIVPTEEQIITATRIAPYNTIINPINTTCPISLTRFDPDSSNNVMIIRYCGHIFVPDDLRQWFTRNVRCPLCRYDIRNYYRNNDVENIMDESDDTNNNDDANNNDETNNNNDITNSNIENTTSTINDGSNNFIRTFTRTFESNDLRDLSQQLIETFASLEEAWGNDVSNNILNAIVSQMNNSNNNNT